MRLRLGLGILLLVFLVAFSCTTKKPTKFDEFTLFKGKITDQAGQPVENALVELIYYNGANCVCKPGDLIECATLFLLSTIQPTNKTGEYQISLSWESLGFLFDESSPCQMPLVIFAVGPTQGSNDTTFTLSLQDRAVTQVFDLQLEP